MFKARRIIPIFIFLEALSLLGFVYSGLSLPLLIIIGVATLILSLKNLEWGVYILFGELFVGSRGRLLEHGFVSLRMVIFSAVFLAFLLGVILEGRRPDRIPRDSIPYRPAGSRVQNDIGWRYWLLLLVVFAGAVHGILAGNGLQNIFLDANGYLYLLILPAVLTGIKNKQGLENLLKILAAAIMIIAAKTLILFVWFSYGLPGVAPLYHWVSSRDIGEITGVVGSASRIFMQSQFWALVGLFIFGLSTNSPFPSLSKEGSRGEFLKWLVVASAILSVILSLSRSFWLGLIAGAVFAGLVFVFKFKSYRIFKFGLILLFIAAAELGLIFLIVKAGTEGFAQSFSSRIENPSGEAAGGARLLLLPELMQEIKEAPILGKGFGQEVTYKSYLPDKISPENPDGEITTFAFEWGYLDTLLKIGALGLVIYLLFIARIFRLGWERLQILDFRFEILGFLSALVALLALNITTPYLNHPLGIGYLILQSAILNLKLNEATG